MSNEKSEKDVIKERIYKKINELNTFPWGFAKHGPSEKEQVRGFVKEIENLWDLASYLEMLYIND